MSALSKIRSMITRARQDAPTSFVQLDQDREDAAAELAAARVGIDEAEAAYRGALLGATDQGLAALDGARRAAAIRLDRAGALVDRFAAQTAAADEAQDKAELARAVEAATAAQAAFQAAVERDLPEMAEKARTILALRTEAERTTVVANRALVNAGEEGSLPDVEAFRASPGRPREELRHEVVDLWVRDDGSVAGHQDKIRVGSDGAGSLLLPNASHMHRYTKKRLFEVVEALPAVPGAAPASLDVALVVPDLYAAVQSNDRNSVTEMRAQGPAREVAKVPLARSDRMAAGYRT